MQTRRYYMRTLFAAGSSEDVMHFVWNADKQVQPRPAHAWATPLRLQGRARGLEEASDSVSGVESLQRLMGGPAFELPQADQEHRTLQLHLDGLQQSKALASGEAQTLGASLRNRSSAVGIAEAAMSSARRPPPKSSAKTGRAVGQFVGGGVHVAPVDDAAGKSTFRLTMPNGNTMMLPPPAARRHLEALDGHATHGWDQEATLLAAFALIDTRGAGYLTLAELAGLSRNPDVPALLRFTVLGSYLKRRDWTFFERAFAEPDGCIGPDEWIALAGAAASERGVHLRHVRTQEEHVRIAKAQAQGQGLADSADMGWQWLVASTSQGAAKCAGWFADQARDHLKFVEREAALQRRLLRGDVVWALHGRGVVWLQAAVERVHADGSVDLIYPLMPTTVSRLREAQVASRLVNSNAQAPGKQLADSFSPLDVSLAQVPGYEALDDLQLCGALFDVLSGCFEAMPCRMLVAGLYLRGVRAFIEANGVLRRVAPGLDAALMDRLAAPSLDPSASASEGKKDENALLEAYPPLCCALLAAFRQDVTRAQFLAFASYVAERNAFCT